MSHSMHISRGVSEFPSRQYINTAGSNRTWRGAYGGLPKTTTRVDRDTTVDQFLDHLVLGRGVAAPSATVSTVSTVSTAAHVYKPPSRNAHGEGPCKEAASLGRTDLLVVAYGSGIARKDETACEGAALYGRLETLKYLRSVECPWSEATAHAAAEGGHMDTLRWVIANGCPSDNGTQLYASGNGDLEMVRWLHYRGHPVASSVLDAAVFAGSTDIIDWARSIGVERAGTFTAAVRSENLEVLEHLCRTRHPWEQARVEDCVHHGVVDRSVVSWLGAHGYV